MKRLQRPALVMAAYLGTFLASLDISIVNVALPTLQQALRTDMAGLQWVINAYAIALSALMLSAGPLGDRYGHRRMWLLSVATFTLGSLLCACAKDLSTLVAGRAVQGVAGALLIPSAMPILSHAFPDPGQRARVIGGWSAFSALALVLGPLLGGALVQRAGWPSIFLINLPLGLLALVLGAWGIAERRHPQHAALDPAGQLLSIVALGALCYGLIAIGEHGLLSRVTLLALGAATAGLILFGIVERRVARPLLPLDLFADRRFGMLNLASFVLGFTAYASLFFLSLFFQQAQGHSAAAAGAQLAPQFLLMGVVSLLFGRLVAHLGLHAALVMGYALAGGAVRDGHVRTGYVARLCRCRADAAWHRNGAGSASDRHGNHEQRTGRTRGYCLSHDERAAPGRHEPGHRVAGQPDGPACRTAVHRFRAGRRSAAACCAGA